MKILFTHVDRTAVLDVIKKYTKLSADRAGELLQEILWELEVEIE